MGTIINGKIYRNVKGVNEGIVTDKIETSAITSHNPSGASVLNLIAGSGGESNGQIYITTDDMGNNKSGITLSSKNENDDHIGYIKVDTSGVNISGDINDAGIGSVIIAASSNDGAPVLTLDSNIGSLSGYNSVGGAVGKIEVSGTGVTINGDVDDTGKGKVYIYGSSDDSAPALLLEPKIGYLIGCDSNGDAVGSIEVSSSGVVITGDADDAGTGAVNISSNLSGQCSAIDLSRLGAELTSFNSDEDIIGKIKVSSSGVTINGDFDETGTGYIYMPNLPTSDPQVEGAI
jgi:hypothetical protein